MQLTDEQKQAVDIALTGDNMVIEALAGTGKTTVLKRIAEERPNESGLYVAFNAAIKKEAERKFPSNTDCRTVHSLAHEAVRQEDGWFIDRLQTSERLKFGRIAAELGIDPLVVPHWSGKGTRRLAKGRLAGYTMAMVKRFCSTGDKEISAKHMPRIEGLDPDDEWTVHHLVGNHLASVAKDAWEDLTKSNGLLPFEHSHYLKMFQLTDPVFAADFLLVDEAQDLSGVMVAILGKQNDSQIIVVGDARQQIYEWNGAQNALGKFGGEKALLTKSFRFGPAIAEAANYVLKHMLDDDLRVEGLGGPSALAPLERPDAILSRANSTTIRRANFEMGRGRKVHVEGGGNEIRKFAYAAMDLMAGRFVSHRDLACFESWSEVIDYIDEDELGGELASMVRLVMDIGAPNVVQTVKDMSTKRQADLVISTAHKSKGLEWGKVTLTQDLVGISHGRDYDLANMSTEDRRLLYVAVTRAEGVLDVSALPPLAAL